MGNECIVTNMEPDTSDIDSPDIGLSFRKRHSLDTVVSSMMSKRLLSRSCDEDMAVPVFTHSTTGDVLVSCLEVSCKCKQSEHARLALFNQNRGKAQSQLYVGTGFRFQGTFGRDKRTAGKRRSRFSSELDNHQLKVKATGISSCLHSVEKEASAAELNALKAFAEFFRRRRFELGYTQKDVAAALAEEYRDIEYTQPSIAKFEHLHFSPSRLNQMKMRLEKWLEEAERLHALKGESTVKNEENGSSADEANPGISIEDGIGQCSLRRPALEESIADRLQVEFSTNSYPSPDQFGRIAEELGLNVTFVRRWFANRRRREKMQSPQQLNSNCSSPVDDEDAAYGSCI